MQQARISQLAADYRNLILLLANTFILDITKT